MRALFVMILLVAFILPSRQALASQSIDISKEELQTLHTQAAQGNVDAQWSLGGMYHDGQGMPQDYVQALLWFEKAAAQGSAKSQSYLGMMYFVGQGVPPDYVRSYMWYTVAAAQFTSDDRKIVASWRDRVASRMTPAQLAEAQRLSSQCQAQQFKSC